jgi:hypothetical protein
MFMDFTNLGFWGVSPYQSASNFANLAGATLSSASAVINLTVAEDLGVGQGEAQPEIAVIVGAGITSSCTSTRLNFQFQGSTDSSNWTTYAETGALATSSFAAGANVLPIHVPKRPSGIALPQYYRMNLAITGNANTESISSGTLMGGIIVGGRQDAVDTLGQYASGFTVV